MRGTRPYEIIKLTHGRITFMKALAGVYSAYCRLGVPIALNASSQMTDTRGKDHQADFV